MRFFRRFIFGFSLLVAAALARPREPGLRILLWPLKLLGGALAPIVALVSGLGALLGLACRDWKLAVTSLAGTALSARFLYDLPDTEAELSVALEDGPGTSNRAAYRSGRTFWRWSQRAASARNVLWQRDVAYAWNPQTDRTLLADIWAPSAGGHTTGVAVIYVHGGAWHLGHKDMGTRPFFQRLASDGHVVMDIDYCLWPRVDIPVMVAEVKQAVLWMKDNADLYGIDPTRVILMGGSAGGHLALLSAYTPHHPELPPLIDGGDASVCAVIAYYPPVCFLSIREHRLAMHARRRDGWRPRMSEMIADSLMGRLTGVGSSTSNGEPDCREFVPALLGGSPEECPEAYRLLSPLSHVGTDCSPTLLLQGADDSLGLTPGVRELYRALSSVGAKVVLAEFPHADHAFDLILPRISPLAQIATSTVERFLDSFA